LERDCVVETLHEAEESGNKRLSASARGTLVFDPRQRAVGDARELEVVKKCFQKEFLRKHLRQQQRTIQLCTAFMTAHQSAQTQIASYFGGSEHRFTDSPEEACVVLESQIQVLAAANLLAQITAVVRRKMGTVAEVHRLCDGYRRFVLSAHEGGVLQAKEAEALLEPVAEVLLEMRRDRKKISDSLASECVGADSSAEHMRRLGAALDIQRAWRESRGAHGLMSSAGTKAQESYRHESDEEEDPEGAETGESDEDDDGLSNSVERRALQAAKRRQRRGRPDPGPPAPRPAGIRTPSSPTPCVPGGSGGECQREESCGEVYV